MKIIEIPVGVDITDGKINRKQLHKKLLPDFNNDEMATSVFIDKYMDKLIKGTVYSYKEDNWAWAQWRTVPEDLYEDLTLSQFFEKMASKVYHYGAKHSKYFPEITEKRIFELINNFKYLIFGGSIISGLSKDSKTVLGNCFVVGTGHDSYNSILQTEAHAVAILKRRGGVGTDFTHIRERGSKINNAAEESTGIVPFIRRFSNAILEVSQAKGRRGAGMATIDIYHNDAEEVINAKANTDQLSGVNISMKISDVFMNAIESKDKPLGDIDPYEASLENKLFNLIATNATKYAEPGVLFWDRIKEQFDNRVYSSDGFKISSTNPCGELPLPPYDSCRLASLNLFSYIINPYTDKAEFDIERFKKDVYDSQIIMDIIIEIEIEKIDNLIKSLKKELIEADYLLNHENLVNFKILDDEILMWEKVKKMTIYGRRTGLGMLGIADAMAALNLRYGSNEFNTVLSDISKEFGIASYKASIDMAKELGPFISFSKYKEDNFYEVCKKNQFSSGAFEILKKIEKNHPEYWKKYQTFGRRNIQNLAIAPTGTISMMAGV